MDILMKSWYYMIRIRRNNIKSLYLLKKLSKIFPNKTLFFAIMELVTVRIIENSIIIKDKSMKYSYKL